MVMKRIFLKAIICTIDILKVAFIQKVLGLRNLQENLENIFTSLELRKLAN
jgi:hypothetical protein